MKRLVLLILTLAWVPAHGHDLWLERTTDGLVMWYGHGHSQHEGAKIIDYKREIVVRVDCFDGGGNPVKTAVSSESPLRISGGCAVTYVLTSTGYWSKTAYGTKNVSKREAQSPIKSWLSFESVKRIDGWDDAMSRPLTSDLEITPLENPLLLHAGSKIHLLVTLRGAPVPGATVTYDGEPRGATDKNGRVNLKIRHDGFQAIQAGVTVPLASEEADETIHATSLDFEIGGSK
jgi:nickel transport protein